MKTELPLRVSTQGASQKKVQCIFNSLFFKSWREARGSYTNDSLSSVAHLFGAIILRNQTEGKTMLNSYMLNSIIPGKEEHF